MAILKNRKVLGIAVDKNLLIKFKDISIKTKIPQSKLLDEAIEDLINKYNNKTNTN